MKSPILYIVALALLLNACRPVSPEEPNAAPALPAAELAVAPEPSATRELAPTSTETPFATVTSLPTNTAQQPTVTETQPPTLQPKATELPTDLTSHCVSVVEALDRLREPYADTPDYLTTGDGEKQGGEFDANTYFTVLRHLSLPPGKVLDWVQDVEGIGAEPILYIRETEAPPFATYAEYEAAGGTASIQNSSEQALSEVLVDDTPEGYLELAILRVTAVQFYRYWHAAYNDRQVVCNRTELDAIALEANQAMSSPLGVLEVTPSPEEEDRASAMGFSLRPYEPEATDAILQPVVKLDDGTATVTLAYFTWWGGLVRAKEIFTRNAPHKVTTTEPEVLEKWVIPIVF